MTELAQKTCVPCRGGVPPLTADEIRPLHVEVPDWKVVDNHHLMREFRFVDFRTALKFVDGVGAMAEQQRHHPDIHLTWGKVFVEVWTHKIDGLTESDFIFAAKTDEIWKTAEGAELARNDKPAGNSVSRWPPGSSRNRSKQV
ncbi:MAG: 4a-hydroxytetrahydrobiopterin dehydratase [Bryobacteraceae bacterium]